MAETPNVHDVMRCPWCDVEMREASTDFTVFRHAAVYVVQGVPVFECPRCGVTTMLAKTAQRAEEFLCGRIAPVRQSLAYIYDWLQGEPLATPTTAGGTVALHGPVGTAGIAGGYTSSNPSR